MDEIIKRYTDELLDTIERRRVLERLPGICRADIEAALRGALTEAAKPQQVPVLCKSGQWKVSEQVSGQLPASEVRSTEQPLTSARAAEVKEIYERYYAPLDQLLGS